MSTPPRKPAVHFIGVGGINMSALAQWFLAQKWTVSGSDRVKSPITENAAKQGIRVKIGQKRGILPRSVDLAIRTQAIRPENPELREIRRRRIPILTNPQMVGRLTRAYKTIAVSGAHGKSTTTALTALALRAGGLDPTVIVGTLLREFENNNFRNGKGDWLVLEADEYGRSFLHYTPLYAIVTNIDAEHLDTYRTLGGVKRAFISFIDRMRDGGTLIVNRDDKNLRSLRGRITQSTKGKAQKVIWYSLHDRDVQKIRRVIKIPGDHNVSNALAVLRLARTLRIPERVALRAIGAYRGSWRRMEYRGVTELKAQSSKLKTIVYDDYAHHPTEINATLAAFREKYPHSPLVCVFQPHQAERLKRLWNEFQTAFADADISLILPVYRVAGRDKDHPKYNSRELVRIIQKKQPKKLIFYLEDPKNLKRALTALLVPRKQTTTRSPIIVMMGAGDVVDYTARLVG